MTYDLVALALMYVGGILLGVIIADFVRNR